MSDQHSAWLDRIAEKAITLGKTLTEDERAQFGALPQGDQHKRKCRARARQEHRCLAFARLAVRKEGTETIAASVRPERVRRGPRARGAGRPRTRAVARASSRGGDSGDDGSGSEPPGETTGRHQLYLDQRGAR